MYTLLVAAILIFILCIPNTGVIIIDNVWFYGNDHKSRILNVGALVEIIGEKNTLVKVKYDNVVAKLHKDVLIDLNEKIAEDKLFVFAHGYFDEKEYPKAVQLYEIFIKYFNESKYIAEVLYYCGLSYEEIAKTFDNPDVYECIILNKRSDQWYYSGNVYKLILENFSKGAYASKARYRLINIFRKSNLPWNDSIQVIQQELKMWQEFTKEYQHTEKHVSVLLEIGYLNRVLFQIIDNLNYKEDAIEVFEKIINNYPNSVHSAQAEVHLYEIEKDESVYYY